MNFLIDTNICSAYLKGEQRAWNRFQQYMGGLSISVVTAGKLWTWRARQNTSERSHARPWLDFLIQSTYSKSI